MRWRERGREGGRTWQRDRERWGGREGGRRQSKHISMQKRISTDTNENINKDEDISRKKSNQEIAENAEHYAGSIFVRSRLWRLCLAPQIKSLSFSHPVQVPPNQRHLTATRWNSRSFVAPPLFGGASIAARLVSCQQRACLFAENASPLPRCQLLAG